MRVYVCKYVGMHLGMNVLERWVYASVHVFACMHVLVYVGVHVCVCVSCVGACVRARVCVRV